MKKKILAITLATIMAGNLCADMTALASEPEEVSELLIEEQATVQSEDSEGQATVQSEDSEEQLEIPVQNDVQEEKIENKINAQETLPGGNFGNNNEFYWELKDGVLKISGEGDIWYNDPKWSDYYEQINKIVIEEGITRIATDSLIGGNVTEISIPASMVNMYCEDAVTWDGDGNYHGYLFPFIGKLEKITVAPGNNNYTSIDGVLYSKDLTKLICFPKEKEGTFKIPDGVIELGSGQYMAFQGSKLSSITIPEGVTKLKGFKNCKNLTSIILPSSVNDIGDGCWNCPNLTSITILNKSLVFAECIIDKQATIKGYSGSTAEKFAKENGNKFVALDGGQTENKPVINVSQIKISGNSKIAAGKKVKLTANVSPSNASNKAVTWTSSNKKIATVNSSGVVTMNKKSGGKSVTITATATDGSKVKGTYKITSMKGVVKKVAISGKKTVKAGKTLKLKAKVTASKGANKKLQWTSSNTKYAKVNNSGKVTTLKAGKGKSVKITATATDGSGKKKSVTIKIK